MSDFDEGIDLDFGGIDSITGFVPVPTGAYVLRITEAKVVPTNDGTGRNVEVTMQVAEGELEGRSIGKERWYVPNRAVQDSKKFETTSGYFKGRLEAVYGKKIGDSFKLNVRELSGMQFKGVVLLVDEGYGPQNKVSAHLPMSTDLSNVHVPAPSAPRPKPGNGGGTGEAQPGRFKI